MAENNNTTNTTCTGTVRDSVKQYYGKDLKTQSDCQSGINCLKESPPLAKHVQEAFAMVHEDVTLKYFGCGPVIPQALTGIDVLDLGSGSGRDCFALSKLIGPSGHVVGIDMTEEQLDYSRSFLDYHMQKCGYSKPNVDFRFGYIEKLGDAGIKDNTFDLVISNCVICLCPDKQAVLAEACRSLKDGGEMYFSNIYTDSPQSEKVKNDHVLWGEGMGGALQWQELYRLAETVGFSRPRLVTATMVDTSKFDHLLDGAKFVSVTYRLFKLPKDLQPVSRATYLGGIESCEDKIEFDYATTFKKDVSVVVDAELATILASSRFSKFFRLTEAANSTSETADPKVDPVQWAEKRGLKKNLCGSG
ncbi:arsenite methyltransferase-like [Littorina saxatilis]|uniref:Arsenite methyltransferase n=1 Tax=Littorina saxatilis TaxID=31220 RepID=A0AAN9AR91_9CAEN